MKLKGLVLLALLISTGILNAQTDFRPGYIIKTGDTIFGEIDYRGDLLMGKICKFKDADNTIVEYFPNDIEAFRFIDSKYYVTQEIDDKKVFMEYLIKGKVNIYYMRDEAGDHYYIDKEDVRLTEIPYEEGIKFVNDRAVSYRSTKHIGFLQYYMQDAPELQSRIQSVKKPEHRTLVKLAENYHNTVCEGEQCIIYEKKVPLIKIFPELTSGVINFSNVADLHDKFYMHTGIIGHIWMPRTSENLYFRTGVLFSQLEFEGKKTNFYKIPVQLEYIYPKGIFRPRVAYGLNIYSPIHESVSFNLGGNIKLSESFFLSATSDIEFNPTILILPKNLLSYSLQVGLFMNIN